MAERKGAYGTTSSDTAFRKTWDTAEYTAKAAAREAKEKEEGRARYEAKLAGRKYIPRPSTPSDAKDSASRASRLDVASNVGKTTLVPAGSAVGKRGKGAGFYCADCDLTFKDNLQFVDHLNSKQHLANVGETGEVKRATLEEVRERLAWLKKRNVEEKRELRADRQDLDDRLKTREEDDERRREEKRRKRREKRRKTEGGVGHDIDHESKGTGIIA